MKTYEELAGAEGRRIFYRAERFACRDLFSRSPPRVLLDGTAFELENISMSGVLVSRAGAIGWDDEQIGEEVPITFQTDGGPLFEGRARIVRIVPMGNSTHVGLAFTGQPLDIPALVTRYNEFLIKRELNGGVHHALESVTPEYRQHCADVLHLLRRYRATLSKFDNTRPRDEAQPDPGRLDTLYGLAEERLLPEWRELWRAGNAIVRPLLDLPEPLRAAKEFTEHVLTPEFMPGPIWNRSYRKPLGYPGDYRMMNYVYEWRPRGATVYEKLLHRTGLDVAECIATRMTMIQTLMGEMFAGTPAGPSSRQPGRVLSIGCGSAQEVSNFFRLRSLGRPVEVTLVDQDHDALSYAYEHAYPEVMRHADGSIVRCLQVSFIELMKAHQVFRDLPPQELIYSVGLVDYLSLKRVQRLVKSLYDKLLPGGRLVIGNMADVPGGNLWPMEFLCDWSLYYRDLSEMEAFAGLVPEARKWIEPDPTGRVYMLNLVKPDGAG